MTGVEAGMEGLKLAASLAAFLTSLWMLRSASLADWRQDLFAIRNNLWDRLRAAGCLGAPGGRALREALNGAIRHGPRVTLPSLLVGLWLTRSRATESVDSWAEGVPEGAAIAAVRHAEHAFLKAVLSRVLYDTLPGACFGYAMWGAWRTVRLFRFLTAAADRLAARLKAALQRVTAAGEQTAWEESGPESRAGALC